MEVSNVRHLRRVTPPLASYFRVGHRDGALMAKLLEQGLSFGGGVIVDPSAELRTSDLRSAAVENGVEVILDSRGVELSTIGGMASPSVARLAWAHERPHTPEALDARAIAEMAQHVAQAAVDQRVTGVLAPTHFLDADPRWLEIDTALAGELRTHLDQENAGSTVVYYPLVASLRLLNDAARRAQLVTAMSQLVAARQIDAVFLRVQAFGTNKAGPRNLRGYLAAARSLHQLGIPLVGERTGTVGLALAAFGAVGGIESSITFGDTYDARRLNRLPKGGGFVPPPKPYLAPAMALSSKDDAATITSRNGFARLRCQGPCCAHRRDGMLHDPRRHFVITRTGELAHLSGTPEAERAEHYMTTLLMPARDTSAQIARFMPSFEAHRNRLDDWHLALQRTIAEDAETERTTALVPTGHRFRRSA